MVDITIITSGVIYGHESRDLSVTCPQAYIITAAVGQVCDRYLQ